MKKETKRNQIVHLFFFSLIILVLAVYYNLPQPKLSTKKEENKWYLMKNIWNEESFERLHKYVESIGTIQTASNDATNKISDIGEGRTRKENGDCGHPFLIPNQANLSQCILPNRVDVGRHYLYHGGYLGRKESVKTLTSRLLSFAHFTFDILKNEDLQLLFQSKQYLEKVNELCEDRNHIDPFQLGIIINLPGQEVALHYDAPYFFGASRFTIPQWLLVVMQQSNLFNEIKIPQIQGVAYLHKWNATKERGGEFFFYPEGPSGKDKFISPFSNSGIVCDGSRMLHGTATFVPASLPPPISKDNKNILKFLGDSKWALISNDKQVQIYHTNDFRISFVWRARCFRNEEEKNKWHSGTENFSLEFVLNKLFEDLKSKGILKERPSDPLEFAVILLREYAGMPLPNVLFPFNYCLALEILPPFLREYASIICK